MAFKDKDGIPIIESNGNLKCASMNCKTIKNANETISFMNNFGSHTCYSIGKQKKDTSSNVGIPIIQFIMNTQNTYGGLYCEFILCGSQNALGGFVNKYECTITPNGVRLNNATIADNTEITKTNIGQSDTATVPILTKITSQTTFANDTTTFYVKSGVATGANMYLFYRVLNGGTSNYNYTTGFFKNINVLTTSPTITTVTNSGTFNVSNTTKTVHIIAIGGGGGGGGGVHNSGGTAGGGGGGGATGTFFVGYLNSVPTNKTLTITIGTAGNGESTGSGGGSGYRYPLQNGTAGGNTIVTGTGISITAYGGKNPQSLATIAQVANGPNAGISDNFPAFSGVTQLYSSKGVSGTNTTGGNPRSNSGWYGDGGLNNIFNTEYLNSSNGSVLDSIDISTYGNGGRGGWGESSGATFSVTEYSGYPGIKGVVFIIEY
jgi:hypothetical protein